MNRVILINLEFSASIGFIHKEFVTMHGHMILKFTVSQFAIHRCSTKYVHLLNQILPCGHWHAKDVERSYPDIISNAVITDCMQQICSREADIASKFSSFSGYKKNLHKREFRHWAF